jgi:hypothetical protein
VLSNEQTCKGRDEEAQAHTYPTQPTTTQPSTTAKTVKKKKVVVFIDTDNNDARDEEDKPLSKKKLVGLSVSQVCCQIDGF